MTILELTIQRATFMGLSDALHTAIDTGNTELRDAVVQRATAMFQAGWISSEQAEELARDAAAHRVYLGA